MAFCCPDPVHIPNDDYLDDPDYLSGLEGYKSIWEEMSKKNNLDEPESKMEWDAVSRTHTEVFKYLKNLREKRLKMTPEERKQQFYYGAKTLSGIELDIYKSCVENSEGFDVPSFTKDYQFPFDIIKSVPPSGFSRLQHYVEFAIQKYNFQRGCKLELEKIIRYNIQARGPFRHYITFTATDAYVAGVPAVPYQALLQQRIPPDVDELLFLRPQPDPPAKADVLDVVSPPSSLIESVPDSHFLLPCVEFAIQTYNLATGEKLKLEEITDSVRDVTPFRYYISFTATDTAAAGSAVAYQYHAIVDKGTSACNHKLLFLCKGPFLPYYELSLLRPLFEPPNMGSFTSEVARYAGVPVFIHNTNNVEPLFRQSLEECSTKSALIKSVPLRFIRRRGKRRGVPHVLIDDCSVFTKSNLEPYAEFAVETHNLATGEKLKLEKMIKFDVDKSSKFQILITFSATDTTDTAAIGPVFFQALVKQDTPPNDHELLLLRLLFEPPAEGLSTSSAPETARSPKRPRAF